MLTDYRIEQERWARGMRERRKVAWAFGRFIASLAPWHWFINPLTMRDRGFHGRPEDRGELRRDGNFPVCRPDPRLARYEPSSRYSRSDGPPIPQVALSRIKDWLTDVEKAAGKPIGWMIAEEFGRLGGKVALPRPGDRGVAPVSKEVLAGSAPAIRLHAHRALRPGARGCLLRRQVCWKNSWRNQFWRDISRNQFVEVRREFGRGRRSGRGSFCTVAQELLSLVSPAAAPLNLRKR
jgi:hypothetical protein